MKTSKFLKFFTFIAFVALISPSAFGQSNASRMDRNKAKQHATDSDKNTDYIYLYSVAEVTVGKDRVIVKLQDSESKPTGEKAERQMKMQEKRKRDLEQQMKSFRTETDVLNYFSSTGMELISVVPNLLVDEKSKLYYLRAKIEM